jgi:hypothetical protein
MVQVIWALLGVLVCVAAPGLGAEDVKIIGRDFAFEAPAMLGAGMTTFSFENPGEVRHEMIIVLLRPEVTAQQITEALQGGITLRKLREQFGDGDILGILLASPHQSSAGQLLVNLVRGRTYLLICQIEEPPGAPRHNMLGMYTTLRVE